MPELYLNNSSEKQSENLKPKKETIKFLLDYSKALNIQEYQNKKFEIILN